MPLISGVMTNEDWDRMNAGKGKSKRRALTISRKMFPPCLCDTCCKAKPERLKLRKRAHRSMAASFRVGQPVDAGDTE